MVIDACITYKDFSYLDPPQCFPTNSVSQLLKSNFLSLLQQQKNPEVTFFYFQMILVMVEAPQM